MWFRMPFYLCQENDLNSFTRYNVCSDIATGEHLKPSIEKRTISKTTLTNCLLLWWIRRRRADSVSAWSQFMCNMHVVSCMAGICGRDFWRIQSCNSDLQIYSINRVPLQLLRVNMGPPVSAFISGASLPVPSLRVFLLCPHSTPFVPLPPPASTPKNTSEFRSKFWQRCHMTALLLSETRMFGSLVWEHHTETSLLAGCWLFSHVGALFTCTLDLVWFFWIFLGRHQKPLVPPLPSRKPSSKFTSFFRLEVFDEVFSCRFWVILDRRFLANQATARESTPVRPPLVVPNVDSSVWQPPNSSSLCRRSGFLANRNPTDPLFYGCVLLFCCFT